MIFREFAEGTRTEKEMPHLCEAPLDGKRLALQESRKQQ